MGVRLVGIGCVFDDDEMRNVKNFGEFMYVVDRFELWLIEFKFLIKYFLFIVRCGCKILGMFY